MIHTGRRLYSLSNKTSVGRHGTLALKNLKRLAHLPVKSVSETNEALKTQQNQQQIGSHFSFAPPPTSRKLAGLPP
jgi:hypothetical protein